MSKKTSRRALYVFLVVITYVLIVMIYTSWNLQQRLQILQHKLEELNKQVLTKPIKNSTTGLFFQSKLPSYTQNLILAHQVASTVGIDPDTVQAIMLQESKGGNVRSLVGSRNAGVGDRSYGLMQIKVEAARSVFQKYPTLSKKYLHTSVVKSVTDEEIIALLLTNYEANIRISCYHLKIYDTITHHDWDTTIVAYNMGIGNALNKSDISDNPYLLSVRQYMRTNVLSFNNKHNL